jgi:murein DD-endopeptidase MepM/ murein hydrolase activator NlpD
VPNELTAAAVGAAALLGGSAQITGVTCVATDDVACPSQPGTLAPGADVRPAGEALERADRVVFRGGQGAMDDVTVHLRNGEGGEVLATVARCARSGPLEVLSGSTTLGDAVHVTVTPPQPETRHVFPIGGPHDLGRTATNGFGGGRGHQGQDMFSDCGTPIVAAASGAVRRAEAGDPVAGNHLVLRHGATGDEHVYMHLAAPPRLDVGDGVRAGERIGSVGRSGNAQGCHLHFELWSAPGWQRGEVRDPLPALRRWRAAG